MVVNMKILFNYEELSKELEFMKEGEEILLYERDIRTWKEQRDFQNYLSKLIMFNRCNGIKIKGGLIFKKEEVE